MPHWDFPLDPECPGVEHAFQIQLPQDCTIDGVEYKAGEWIDDPMAGPVWDELMEDFTKKHRIGCKRCQEYGAANVDIAY
jgi:hypothetical protein